MKDKEIEMTEEQKDKVEDLSAEELAQVTGGSLSTVEPIKIKEPLPVKVSSPVSWDIAQNKPI
jgi:hypothetical protein